MKRIEATLCDTELDNIVGMHCRVLRGHRGSVLTLCSLGGLLLSGGRDNIIRVWDMEALVCRRTLPGHRDDVMCIAGLGLQAPLNPLTMMLR